MNNYKLVCFDMDGTLITNTNSVEYLCVLNGKDKEAKDIELQEENDIITWIDADYEKAKLFKGLHINSIDNKFEHHVELINNIDKVLEILKIKGIKTILITAGPIQVADVLGNRFGFDKIYGSNYEVVDGCFTGKIIEHLGDDGKLRSLMAYCKENKITLNSVIAIGDSASDIKVLEKSRKSIAINYSYKLEGKADIYLRTYNLYDIIEYII